MLKVLGVGASFVTAHSAYLAYRSHSVHSAAEAHKRQQQALFNSENDFRAGSTEDMLLDSVRSGDVVLVSRRWFLHHVPMGLCLLLYRRLAHTRTETQSDAHTQRHRLSHSLTHTLTEVYDHAGVVLVDRFGTPYLLENSPYRGVQCRPLSQRLLRANSSETIVVLPLLPQDRERQREGTALLQELLSQAHTHSQRETLTDTQTHAQSKREMRLSFSEDNELVSLSRFVVQRLLLSLSLSAAERERETSDPNVLFLRRVFSRLGLSLTHRDTDTHTDSEREISLMDIAHRNVVLTKEGKEFEFDSENLPLRTS